MSNGELFHYTTAEGLMGILQKQNLRATHYRHLNDSTEMGFIVPHIVKKFYVELANFFHSDSERFGLIDDVLLNNYADHQARVMFQIALDQIDAMSPVFMCSLCCHTSKAVQKSGLLSQWRGYGASGGYCIVFDEAKMLKMLEELQDRKKFSSLQHKLVQYSGADDEIDLGKLDGLAVELYKSKYNGFCNGSEVDTVGFRLLPFKDVTGINKLDQLLYMVLGDLPFYKNSAFIEEQEYRVASAALMQSSPSPEGTPPPYLFGIKNNELVPFIYLFSDDVKLPITRIIVGPGGSGMRRVHGAGQLARSLGLGYEIVQSEIPFD